MIRITTVLWIALLVVAGGTVMHVSYQVRHVQKHLSELARSTQQEWDTLNDPQRIDALAKRHLALESTPIARVVALEAIPLKLSDDQAAKLSVASAKANKAQGVAPAPVARKPDMQVAATGRESVARPAQTVTAARPTAPQSRDDVGLILARMERRE